MLFARLAVVGYVVAGAGALVGCGSSDSVRPPSNPALQCDGGRSGMFDVDLDPSVPYPATIDLAIDPILNNSRRQYGGTIQTVDATSKALVVDGRRVIIVAAHPAPAGGFWPDHTDYCSDYFTSTDTGLDTPATAPLVTLG